MVRATPADREVVRIMRTSATQTRSVAVREAATLRAPTGLSQRASVRAVPAMARPVAERLGHGRGAEGDAVSLSPRPCIKCKAPIYSSKRIVCAVCAYTAPVKPPWSTKKKRKQARGMCPDCFRRRQLRANGTVGRHSLDIPGEGLCPGEGKRPLADG